MEKEYEEGIATYTLGKIKVIYNGAWIEIESSDVGNRIWSTDFKNLAEILKYIINNEW
jgi:hypothetical protein